MTLPRFRQGNMISIEFSETKGPKFVNSRVQAFLEHYLNLRALEDFVYFGSSIIVGILVILSNQSGRVAQLMAASGNPFQNEENGSGLKVHPIVSLVVKWTVQTT